MRFRDSPAPVSSQWHIQIAQAHCAADIYVNANPNVGMHMCVSSTLQTESSLQTIRINFRNVVLNINACVKIIIKLNQYCY